MDQADKDLLVSLTKAPSIRGPIAGIISTGVLGRITVEELIQLTIDLASRSAADKATQEAEDKAARIHRLVLSEFEQLTAQLSPPPDWYITKSALWKQNPNNPGRPTVLARMTHAGVLLVHSPEVWRYLQRIVPLPPAITELRKLHGEDVPTGAMPLATSPSKDKS